MKNLKRIFIMILGPLLILSLVIGCSSQRNSSPQNFSEKDSDYTVGTDGMDSGNMFDSEYMEESTDDMAEMDNIDNSPRNSDSSSDSSSSEPDKLITTVSINMETTEFQKTVDSLDTIMKSSKGYIGNSNISYNENYNRRKFKYGYFQIRIPKENLDNFMIKVRDVASITSESTNKEDVTKQYSDMESRLKVLETKEERILALLDKADKIEDVLTLENRLSETIMEKESIKRNLLSIDDQVDYSTVNIEIREVENLIDPETVETPFGTRIKNTIQESLFEFGRLLENIFLGLIYILPYIFVVGILVFIFYRIYKKYNKNKS